MSRSTASTEGGVPTTKAAESTVQVRVRLLFVCVLATAALCLDSQFLIGTYKAVPATPRHHVPFPALGVVKLTPTMNKGYVTQTRRLCMRVCVRAVVVCVCVYVCVCVCVCVGGGAQMNMKQLHHGMV